MVLVADHLTKQLD